jgi:hypothetical protein
MHAAARPKPGNDGAAAPMLCVYLSLPNHQAEGDLQIQLPHIASPSAQFGIPGATGGPEIPQNFDVFNIFAKFFS